MIYGLLNATIEEKVLLLIMKPALSLIYLGINSNFLLKILSPYTFDMLNPQTKGFKMTGEKKSSAQNCQMRIIRLHVKEAVTPK